MVPDLLVLPPGIDLHDHPLVINGSVFMQVRFILLFILHSRFKAVSCGPDSFLLCLSSHFSSSSKYI